MSQNIGVIRCSFQRKGTPNDIILFFLKGGREGERERGRKSKRERKPHPQGKDNNKKFF